MPPDLSKNSNACLSKFPLDGLFFLVIADYFNRRLKLKGNLQGKLPFLLRKQSARIL